MTIVLRAYQRDLLERLEHEAGSGRMLISAPTGVGVSTVLVEFVARTVANGGSVVVIVSAQMLVEQWIDRLQTAGVDTVKDFRSTSNAVEALGKADPRGFTEPGVIVTTAQVLRHGAGRHATTLLTPNLLVLERLPVLHEDAPDESIVELTTRSERVIAVVSGPIGKPWLDANLVYRLSFADAIRQGLFPWSLQWVTYQTPRSEFEAHDAAERLLRRIGFGPVTNVSSRPALHTRLVRLANSLGGDNGDITRSDPVGDTSREVWEVIDRIEALEIDTRLEVAVRLARSAVESGHPVHVATEGADETEYIAGRLSVSGVDAVALSGSTSHSVRQSAMDHFSSGAVLVSPTALLRGWEAPERTQQIWWSAPRSRQDAETRMARLRVGGTAVAVMGEPPLRDDRRLLRIIRELEEDVRREEPRPDEAE
jgi:hypothetical protein